MKCESEVWLHSGESSMKKVCKQKLAGKVMLITFFDCRGMVYQNVCPPKMWISKEYYTVLLERLLNRISRGNDQNFFGSGFFIKTMLSHIQLLLYKCGLSATTMKQWSIHQTAQNSHCAITNCFYLCTWIASLELRNRCSADPGNPHDLWTQYKGGVQHFFIFGGKKD